MTNRLRELQEKRQKSVAASRAILDQAEKEGRALTTEEQVNWDKAFSEQEELRSSIEREQRQIDLDREMAETRGRTQAESGEGGNAMSKDELEMRGFRGRILNGPGYGGEGAQEFRALQADADTAGGYLVTPQQFVAQLIKDLDNEVLIRKWATVLPLTNADGVGIPTLDTDPDDADWTSEIRTGNEDSAMKFGKRELKPHPLAKRIKISRKLLRNGALPVEQIVRERLAYKFAVSMEKAFLTGTGAGQPLGLFTASSNGISTGRDVSSENGGTAPTFNGLTNAKFSLKAGYLANSKWLFHRDCVKAIAKITDGQGQYIWQPSKKDGEPDTLLGRPLFMSEYAPNTMTSGQYVGLIGDFSHYWIADSLLLDFQILNELYAETNQVGMIGRLESDAMPVQELAFARVKLG